MIKGFITLGSDFVACQQQRGRPALAPVQSVQCLCYSLSGKVNMPQSCQPRVTGMSCFVYKVIRDLESIDHW